MLALGRYEVKVCDCGFHESVAHDPDTYFTFEDKVCPICQGAARYGRMLNKADERLRKARGEKATADPADGRRTFIRPMSSGEVEGRREGRGGNQA